MGHSGTGPHGSSNDGKVGHTAPSVAEDRMLKWFDYNHLPSHLQPISREFCNLAAFIANDIPPGPERTVALRKLLEAKDAAVRAVVHPGG